MEFANRLAGVGNQAGLSQAQIMAFGSVLDQNAVNVEKGATALQNVFTALFKNPAKMAQAAGLEVQKFTELLSTDANAALIDLPNLTKFGRGKAVKRTNPKPNSLG